MGSGIGKAEGILANQREGQWRREGKTAEMREEGENRLKMERAAEREKGSVKAVGRNGDKVENKDIVHKGQF